MPEETAHGSAAPSENGSRVSFSELARVHHRWAEELHTKGEPSQALDDAYHERLDRFERDAGRIVDAYWCRADASAVALTERDEGRADDGHRRLMEGERGLRLHRVTDWVTADVPEIPDLLHQCDILAIRATEALTGTQQAVVLQWLLSVEMHVLGFIERHRNRPWTRHEVVAFSASERRELRRIETYYHLASENRARLRYAQGMLFGLLLVVLLGLAVAGAVALFGTLDRNNENVREFFAALAAGAAGATVSVLMRMTGRGGGFVIDHELGALGVLELGMFRPLIGAVFGGVFFFLAQTFLLPIEDSNKTLAFFVVLAFFAGFSERWAKVVLSGAMRVIGGDDEDDAREGRRRNDAATGLREDEATAAADASTTPAPR